MLDSMLALQVNKTWTLKMNNMGYKMNLSVSDPQTI